MIVPRSFDIFYQTIASWLHASISLIAGHSFRRGMSESDLNLLSQLAHTVLLHCDTSPEEAQRCFIERERSNPHARVAVLAASIHRMEHGTYDWTVFDSLDIAVPTLRVDTTDGYSPAYTRLSLSIRVLEKSGLRRERYVVNADRIQVTITRHAWRHP